MKEQRLKVFMNRVMRKIFEPKRDECSGENYKEELMICTAHQILFVYQMEKNEMDGARSAYGGEEKRIQGFGGQA